MDLSALQRIPPDQLRALLPAFLAGYLDSTPELRAEVVSGASRVLEGATDAELQDTMRAWAALGGDWGVHEALPLLRRLARDWMPRCLPGARVEGLEHLQAVAGTPQLWVGNHLSYIDTQVTDSLLIQAGYAQADQLLVVAGPKVYSDPFRRVAAAALNTLMTPQSTQLAHNTAALSPREVGVLALRCLREALQWQQRGRPVLIYPEGSRSRSGRLGPFLKAVARYTRESPIIVPMALMGSERVFDYDERMRPASVVLRIGAPLEPAAGKTAALEQAWEALASLLDEDWQPAPETPAIR